VNADEREIVSTVRQFVDREVLLGVYGLAVPPQHGRLGVSTACFAAVTDEPARGSMSLAGAMGGHSVVVSLLAQFGTDDRADRGAVQDRSGRLSPALRHEHSASRAGAGADTEGRDLPKLSYKGVETCELAFDACRVPAAQLLGGEPGRGFQRTVIARQLVERGLPWV
jgi:alkylation response protein AidB-like acyl-CoA dehydrogenase